MGFTEFHHERRSEAVAGYVANKLPNHYVTVLETIEEGLAFDHLRLYVVLEVRNKGGTKCHRCYGEDGDDAYERLMDNVQER